MTNPLYRCVIVFIYLFVFLLDVINKWVWINVCYQTKDSLMTIVIGNICKGKQTVYEKYTVYSCSFLPWEHVSHSPYSLCLVYIEFVFLYELSTQLSLSNKRDFLSLRFYVVWELFCKKPQLTISSPSSFYVHRLENRLVTWCLFIILVRGCQFTTN